MRSESDSPGGDALEDGVYLLVEVWSARALWHVVSLARTEGRRNMLKIAMYDEAMENQGPRAFLPSVPRVGEFVQLNTEGSGLSDRYVVTKIYRHYTKIETKDEPQTPSYRDGTVSIHARRVDISK